MRLIFLLFLLIPVTTFSQPERKAKIDTRSLIELLLNTPGEVKLDNVEIYFNSNDLREYESANKGSIKYDSLGRIIIQKRLVIKNSLINFYSQNIAISSFWIENSIINSFWYEDGISVTPNGNKPTVILIQNSFVDDLTLLESSVTLYSYDNKYSKGFVRFKKCELQHLDFKSDDLNNLQIDSCVVNELTMYRSRVGNFECIRSFIKSEVIDGGEYSSIEISRNELDELVIIYPTINKSLLLHNNSFRRVSLKSSLENFYFDIDWEQLSGNRISHATNSSDNTREKMAFVNPMDTSVTLNKENYFPIIEVYSKLIMRYKALGRLEDSNSAFVEFKDLEGARYYALYKSKGGANNYFRWKLNRLMKFYTEHGTDPSRAIIISIYIIIAFGLFYVFFPSDWDTISKSKLVKNFSDFRRKNEKGYFKPFLILLLGLMISFLNAITLSLNAFTTLGFGNIPTHGIARYVCVLEGFIGWFLLSIFTVALINQVLA